MSYKGKREKSRNSVALGFGSVKQQSKWEAEAAEPTILCYCRVQPCPYIVLIWKTGPSGEMVVTGSPYPILVMHIFQQLDCELRQCL